MARLETSQRSLYVVGYRYLVCPLPILAAGIFDRAIAYCCWRYTRILWDAVLLRVYSVIQRKGSFHWERADDGREPFSFR